MEEGNTEDTPGEEELDMREVTPRSAQDWASEYKAETRADSLALGKGPKIARSGQVGDSTKPTALPKDPDEEEDKSDDEEAEQRHGKIPNVFVLSYTPALT